MRRTFAALLAAVLLVLGSSDGGPGARRRHRRRPPPTAQQWRVSRTKIQITMSNSPAVIGSQVLVLDETGGNWAQGDVDVLDTVATQAVRPGAPAGKYTVKWRLVSSDSHPIEGEFTFTATAAGAGATARRGVGAGPIQSVQEPTEAARRTVAGQRRRAVERLCLDWCC